MGVNLSLYWMSFHIYSNLILPLHANATTASIGLAPSLSLQSSTAILSPLISFLSIAYSISALNIIVLIFWGVNKVILVLSLVLVLALAFGININIDIDINISIGIDCSTFSCIKRTVSLPSNSFGYNLNRFRFRGTHL